MTYMYVLLHIFIISILIFIMIQILHLVIIDEFKNINISLMRSLCDGEIQRFCFFLLINCCSFNTGCPVLLLESQESSASTHLPGRFY